MKKKWKTLAVISALLILICGCGKNSAPDLVDEGQESLHERKVTLSIYAQYMDEDTRVPYDYAVEELAREFPDVELNLIAQEQDDGETLETLAAIGELPDIFQANTNIINTFRETSQVMELDRIAKESGYLDKLYENSGELAYSDDGHIYCFPYAGNEYVLWYYNKRLFKECGLKVPKTYQELEHCIRVFREHGIVPMALFGQEGWVTTAMYDVIATRYAPGGIKALDQGKASVKDRGYVKAARVLQELVQEGMFQPNVTMTTYDQASELFMSGEAAMFLNGQWYIQEVADVVGDDVDWMPYPAASKDDYRNAGAVLSGGGSTSGFAVNPNGENAELAARVAEFLAEKYCEAKVMYRGNPMVAVNTGAEPRKPYSPMMRKLSEMIPKLAGTTKFTWGLSNPAFNETIIKNTQGLVSGEYTADEFTALVAEDMDKE